MSEKNIYLFIFECQFHLYIYISRYIYIYIYIYISVYDSPTILQELIQTIICPNQQYDIGHQVVMIIYITIIL